MVLFLKNYFKCYNHRILIKFFKVNIIYNKFKRNMWLYLIILRKYKKFSMVLQISQRNEDIIKK